MKRKKREDIIGESMKRYPTEKQIKVQDEMF
jgi:hypothetical protein